MGKKRSMLNIYRSYNFVGKDPAIDVVRTAVENSKTTYKKIHELGGPVPTTLYNWFDGKTKRPQACTLASTMISIGGDVVYKMPNGSETSLRKLTAENTVRLAAKQTDRRNSVPVDKILKLSEEGMGASQVANKLNISRASVYRILDANR